MAYRFTALFTSVFLLISLNGYAQMRIGSNAAATEMLHVEGAILIGESTIGSPEAGTIRWNTTANPDIFEGFDGTNWIPLQGDNLGDHTATENLILDDNWLSNDGGDEGIFILNNGNVGVGTDSPSGPFHVNKNGDGELVVGLFEHFIPMSSSGSTAGLKVTGRRGQATNDVAFLEFENNSTNTVLSRIHIRSDDKLRFSLNNSGSLAEEMTLDNDGNLELQGYAQVEVVTAGLSQPGGDLGPEVYYVTDSNTPCNAARRGAIRVMRIPSQPDQDGLCACLFMSGVYQWACFNP